MNKRIVFFTQDEMLIARISAQNGVGYVIATTRQDLQSDYERNQESQPAPVSSRIRKPKPTANLVHTPVIMSGPE